jgi:hypothetical protein
MRSSIKRSATRAFDSPRRSLRASSISTTSAENRAAPTQRRVLAALANSQQSLYSKTTLLTFELDKSAAQQATQALIYDGDVSPRRRAL